MAWSNVTASGSATTWSGSTAGGSATTWSGGYSRQSFGWIPYGKQPDLWLGVDFIPKASSEAPLKLDTTRPAVVWDLSAITASGFTAEAHP